MTDTMPALPALTDVPAGTAAQQDAFARIREYLTSLGLPESLAARAWGWVQQGYGPETISMEIQNSPEYKARTDPVNKPRLAAGLPQMSLAEIVSFENQAKSLMRQSGLPSGFYDSSDDFVSFLVNDVSVNELSHRINDGFIAAQQAPQETRNELARLYGIDTGHLAAYYLDPNKALPLLQRQFGAAQTAGAATRTGYGQLTQGQAERLGELGVSAEEAQRGFGDLVHQRELFNALPGENADEINTEDQLGAAFGGNEFARERIRRRAERRAAEFGGGGQAATTSRGVTGLSPSA